MDVTIRAAQPADAEPVACIYNAQVTGSIATFDTELRSVAEQRNVIERRDPARHPFLVAVDERGEVLGFGSVSAYKQRAAYRHTVEDSVYVDAAAHGRGVGRALLGELLRLADAAGHHTVLAFVAEPNPASCRLHESFGFVRAGVQREVGWKFDRWIDVTMLQRIAGGTPG